MLERAHVDLNCLLGVLAMSKPTGDLVYADYTADT